MECPKCGCVTRTIDIVHTPDNETLRKKRCPECKHISYSIEFESEYDDVFKKAWNKHYRRSGKEDKQ